MQVLVRVRLVVLHVMSASLHSCLTKALGLPVRLGMVNGGEKVLGAQYSAYEVQELGHQLFSVAG